MKRITLASLFCLIAAAGLSACGHAEPPRAVKVQPVAGGVETAAAKTPSCCEPATQPAGESAGPATQPAVQAVGVATQPAPETTPGIAPGTVAGASGSHASEWLPTDKRFKFDLNFGVTDQAGKHGKLADYAGTPVALSFIFTRCANPQMCPLITTVTGAMQRDVAKAGLAGKVRLLLVSYDPDYDTPERLKKYAEEKGIAFDDGLVAVLRPDRDDLANMLTELGVAIGGTPDGQINHRAELLLLDKQGRFVRDYRGRVWNPEAVTADLGKLAAE